VITDGVLYLRVIAFAQIGQSFELILEGALAGAGTRSGRRSRALAHGDAHSARRVVVATARAAGDLARLERHRDFPGIAMILFWNGGRWRTVRV